METVLAAKNSAKSRDQTCFADCTVPDDGSTS
jgi:hypothetical protein